MYKWHCHYNRHIFETTTHLLLHNIFISCASFQKYNSCTSSSVYTNVNVEAKVRMHNTQYLTYWLFTQSLLSILQALKSTCMSALSFQCKHRYFTHNVGPSLQSLFQSQKTYFEGILEMYAYLIIQRITMCPHILDYAHKMHPQQCHYIQNIPSLSRRILP